MRRVIKKVAVTGAAGQIADHLLFSIARGDFLGPEQPISLRLLDVPEHQKILEGVKMELDDCAFPLLQEVCISSVAEQCFEGIEYAFLVGAKPRTAGQERKDLLLANAHIFKEQGNALNEVASRDVRVLVIGNPCNTNCLIALHNAPDLHPNHFYSMTRLDQNRAQFMMSQKANCPIESISNLIIWGNHSTTQVPDFFNARIHGKPLLDCFHDRHWLENEFFAHLQKRGAEVIQMRGKSSAGSAAKAAIDAFSSIVNPSKALFSTGIYSHSNSYGIEKDLVFSFPCQNVDGDHLTIANGFILDDFLKKKLELTQKELMDERDQIRSWL